MQNMKSSTFNAKNVQLYCSKNSSSRPIFREITTIDIFDVLYDFEYSKKDNL